MALNVFSITDYRHNIINPAILLLARIALECHIQSNEDCLQSAYLVSILEDYSLQSRRMIPEMYSLLTRLCNLMCVLFVFIMIRLLSNDDGRWKGHGNGPVRMRSKHHQ